MRGTVITGVVLAEGDGFTIRFNRRVVAPASKVWAALTEPVRLREWLAHAEFDARVGGAVHLVWPDQGEMRGRVRALEEPSLLEYTWDETNYTSFLRFEVDHHSDSWSTLRLIHSGSSRDDAPGFGAGWQGHLEALDEVLAGGVSTPEQRDARYHELIPLYVAAVASR